MKIFKKVLKITGITSFLLLLVFYGLFYTMTAPKSDEKVLEAFEELGETPVITRQKFKGFEYRKVAIVKDTNLPSLVFVHGTIGSVLDFKRYMTDSSLLRRTNMLVYDRIGYNYKDKNDVQESISFEVDMLEDMIKDLNPEKTILVGYSYGGPIALASKKKYKKIILFAPAVYAKVEPMPAMINVYKWQLTRWLVPPIWKQASKEKISHQKDLEKFEDSWTENPSEVLCVHGDADWIVPFANSKFLQNIFPEEQLTLQTISGAGHDLIWSEFAKLKRLLLNAVH